MYVGIQTAGTTSRLRADCLDRLLVGGQLDRCDTDKAFRNSPRWARSLAFRFKAGPAVAAVNHMVQDHLSVSSDYNLIWLDKAVYLWPETVRMLRSRAGVMIHYTPDTAFFANHSRHFNATVPFYDLVVSTKSFETEQYLRLLSPDRFLLVTQSFDSQLHVPRTTEQQKRREVVFVGLCEPDREQCLDALLACGVPVRLGGKKWDRFCRRHQGNVLLVFEGAEVFGDHYAECLSRASIGLGLLTKRFPELHTTRSFEIPACGTVLATERTKDLCSFFREEEVLFFGDHSELALRVSEMLAKSEVLESMAAAGYSRVKKNGCSNEDVLRRVLKRAGCDVRDPASTAE